MAGAAVWRDYDQAALDVQYNSRGTVPDFALYTREYAERTRAAKADLVHAHNLRYGEGADEVLDIYPASLSGASDAPGAPLLVFFHGGDWRALSKEDSGFAAPAFVAAGVSLVVPDFSLVPDTTIPAMGGQARRVIAWLHASAGAHGGDAARIHIAGHSSGANLVGQVLMTDWEKDFGLPADIIKSACFMSGLGDLEPVRLSFRNENLRLTPETVERVSLLRSGDRIKSRCPMLVAVGEKETEDYRRQSGEVAAYWRGQGNAVELFELAGRNHFDAVLEWADRQSALFRAQLARMLFSRETPHV
jgi:arylformamidase